jgi:penicillin-binding protein 2
MGTSINHENRTRNLGTWFRCGICLAALLCAPAMEAKTKRHHVVRKHVAVAHPAPAARTTTQAAVLRTGATVRTKVSIARRRSTKRVFFNPWTEPTYADSTIGDNVEGEDMVVRKAAVDALGPYNGSVVITDPTSGRILSVVNQKLALKGAFQPCSTIKVMVSLASLHEGIVEPGTPVHLTRRFSMDMTRALAMSNNMYFAHLGEELGFDRVHKYGEMFGLGEKAGLDIPGEEPGTLADSTPQSGVGMMTSFGDGIRLTPLELSGIIGTVANGGTLYYLQYPRTQDEVQRFVPRIKRELDFTNLVSEIRPGMMGAVEYGTARRANFDSSPIIYGKTGTCTDTAQPGVHLGWFGSFTEVGNKKVSVVVLLTGGRGVSGPIASSVAGNVYHNLAQAHYFEQASPSQSLPTALVSTQTVSSQSLVRQ